MAKRSRNGSPKNGTQNGTPQKLSRDQRRRIAEFLVEVPTIVRRVAKRKHLLGFKDPETGRAGFNNLDDFESNVTWALINAVINYKDSSEADGLSEDFATFVRRQMHNAAWHTSIRQRNTETYGYEDTPDPFPCNRDDFSLVLSNDALDYYYKDLSTEERLAVQMIAVEDCTVSGVAGHFGINIKGAMELFQRAKRKVVKRLQEAGKEGADGS
jgi:hypothetical protein